MSRQLLRQALHLQEKNQDEEAGRRYAEILRNDPLNYSALFNNAILLRRQKKYSAARTCYQRAVQLRPEDASLWSNYGNLLCDMFLFEEAQQAHDKALAIGGATPANLYNAGVVPFKNNDPETAIEIFSTVLEQQPDSHSARWNRALCYLQLGDFINGFAEYEQRMEKAEMYRDFGGLTPWRGEDLKDKKILLIREQGLGDMIQFVRFAQLLQQRGAEVFLETQAGLKRFMFCVTGVDHVVDQNYLPEGIDYYVPVMSLPRLLQVRLEDLPATQQYVDAARFIAPQELPGNSGLKVGLVWASKPGHASDRSCPLELFLPLLACQGADFYSFQKGDAVEDIYRLGVEGLIHDLDDDMPDFYDTACYMKQMDLLISIDSSPLHCAAALGVNTWGLLLHAAEWRWLLDRSDSPWYPSLRLYRQTGHKDWSQVMDRLVTDFHAFVSGVQD
jgi:tetratricopeptide (TPR) repeat protein